MYRDRVYALLFLAVALLLAGLFFPFTGVEQILVVLLFLCTGLWLLFKQRLVRPHHAQLVEAAVGVLVFWGNALMMWLGWAADGEALRAAARVDLALFFISLAAGLGGVLHLIRILRRTGSNR